MSRLLVSWTGFSCARPGVERPRTPRSRRRRMTARRNGHSRERCAQSRTTDTAAPSYPREGRRCAGLCLLSIAPRDREPTRRVHRCCDDAETATIKMLSAARATFCRLSDIRRVFRGTERTLSSSLRRVAIALTASTVIVGSDTVRRARVGCLQDCHVSTAHATRRHSRR